MSWCRFSTICENNRSSDLYVFESAYGVEIHLAASRLLNEEQSPRLPDFWECDVQEFIAAQEARDKWAQLNCQRVNIDLPHAGDVFIKDTEDKEGLTLLLDFLRELGYNFPNYLYDYLEDECK